MDVLLFGMVLPWLLVGVGCWLAYQLIRQNGRLLLRLEALETTLQKLSVAHQPSPNPPPSLPVGALAPDFELPDLAGNHWAAAQFRGRRVLLIFFSPDCGFCMQMAPDLATLDPDARNGRPLPLVIASGKREAIQELVREYGIRCPVLHDERREVLSRYQASGTPTGYLVNEQGAIASALTIGAADLLALANAAGAPTMNGQGKPGGEGLNGMPKGKANRGLHTSHINRSGLKAGTPAPGFRLPRLEGGELALEEYRGRQVLLIFSDPECGPCDELAHRLEQLQRGNPDVQILMVSRGDKEANRAKVQQYGLTFPVVLQKQWEISRVYGMFATPIGYLIDEHGIIAADVATGVEPVLALVSGSHVLARGSGFQS